MQKLGGHAQVHDEAALLEEKEMDQTGKWGLNITGVMLKHKILAYLAFRGRREHFQPGRPRKHHILDN